MSTSNSLLELDGRKLRVKEVSVPNFLFDRHKMPFTKSEFGDIIGNCGSVSISEMGISFPSETAAWMPPHLQQKALPKDENPTVLQTVLGGLLGTFPTPTTYGFPVGLMVMTAGMESKNNFGPGLTLETRLKSTNGSISADHLRYLLRHGANDTLFLVRDGNDRKKGCVALSYSLPSINPTHGGRYEGPGHPYSSLMTAIVAGWPTDKILSSIYTED